MSARHFEIASDEFGLYQKRDEILAFLDFARRAGPRVACEVGTWQAGTTFLLASLLPSLALLIGVDREIRNAAKLRSLAPTGLRLHLVEGLSAEPATIERVSEILGGDEIDLLFIDGGHKYEAVKADFLAYRSFVRDGGLIAFHDIVLDYRTRFGARDGPWVGDVPKLWEKLRRTYRSFEFVDDPEQDGYGIGVLVHENCPLPPELRELLRGRWLIVTADDPGPL
jgi:predicted O-methyltransferase YrrM